MGSTLEVVAERLGPWGRILVDEDKSYEQGIVAWMAVGILANLAGRMLAKRSSMWASRARAKPAGSAEERKSYIELAATAVGYCHAVFVTIMAARVVLRLDPTAPELDEELFQLWRLTMQASMGYFLADALCYCLQLMSMPILAHHVILFSCHVGVGSKAALEFFAPPHLHSFLLWASAAGYLCEGSNLFLNNRWFLMQVLAEHSQAYFVNNVLLLIVYLITRLFWFSYIIWRVYDALERFEGKAASGYFIIAGYVLTLLMSMMWLKIMLKNGVKAFVTLRSRRPKKEQ